MKNPESTAAQPLFILLISVHGLIRGHDLELGRDADTGGQTKYVVELARALGERADVERVILLTRRVIDEQVSPDYAEEIEPLSDRARMIGLFGCARKRFNSCAMRLCFSFPCGGKNCVRSVPGGITRMRSGW